MNSLKSKKMSEAIRALARVDFTRVDVLIVDPDDFSWRLQYDTLRAHGFQKIYRLISVAEAHDFLKSHIPTLLIFCPELESEHRFVANLRSLARQEEERYPQAKIPVVVVGREARLCTINNIRNFGANEFVIKPFSVAAYMRCIIAALTKPREFIIAAGYVGPCRRRNRSESFGGRLKRVRDGRLKMQRQSRQKYLEILKAEINNQLELYKSPYFTSEMREHLLSNCAVILDKCQLFHLNDIAEAINSLSHYLKSSGNKANMKLVRVHLQAVLRLSAPVFEDYMDRDQFLGSLRDRVRLQLKREASR
jgi:CheY-like chemotaxis protein